MLNRSKLDRWCDAVLEAGWLAAVVVAPLFFNVFSSRVFEPDKISLVRTLALTMAVVWLVKVANGGFAWLPVAGSNGPGMANGALETDSTGSPEVTGQNWRGFVRNPFFIPVALLIVAYTISTIFSVAGFVSWFGSYQRLQGTYSFFAYVLIGGLTAATLRRPEQIRRLQHAIIIVGLACSIYGVVQHYDIDPLPWGGDTTIRVAGNAGNSIFLGAVLIITFFVTLERVFSSFVRLLGIGQPVGADTQDWQTSLAGGAYLFILLVQTVAIVWTQSRGPWLGLFFGIYLFVLLTLSAVRPRFYRRLTIAWVALGVGGALFLVALNTVPALNFVRQAPYVGRLVSVLDLEEGTNRVRTLIWEGASQLVVPHEPLTFPDGEKDAINILRPLVGYGPEAMWIAYNRFYPPALANVEARNASPDRSHNETWDSLVVTGLFGFLAYTAVFLTIFYWALRWLNLIGTRRDKILLAIILAITIPSVVLVLVAYDQWRLRLFGVALPFGLVLGYGIYVTLAAFRQGNERPDRNELPRQMLIIALLAAIIAHYMEIHFAIAIGATRTLFWVLTAALMVIGMRLAQPQPAEIAEQLDPAAEAEAAAIEAAAAASTAAASAGKGSKGRSKTPSAQAARAAQTAQAAKAAQAAQARRARKGANAVPFLPATIMSDVLVFLTFVYIYTTNAGGAADAFAILGRSVTFDASKNAGSPAILFLLFFTWLIAATIGLAAESLAHKRAPSMRWWVRGYVLHAAIVWGAWLIYGLWQASRLIPMQAGPGMTNQQYLDLQLDRVAGHFGLYTGLLVTWVLVAGTVYAWPGLRSSAVPVVRRPLLAGLAGAAGAVLAIFLVITVNINLVKADIVYKQGQQFDQQGNWLSSVELYRRALATRQTEDQYMLFLGRALLEQAKQAPAEGTYTLPAQPTLNNVLALSPDQVAQMSRAELLRAAETVLLDAQNVNPLNTDHTANLARLYRTWADLVANDPAQRQEMLLKSIAMYDKAVMLSPNAAHLWNERGNAFAADGDDMEALASYEKSLSIDKLFDQTYLLLADVFERTGQTDRLVPLLNQGIEMFTNANVPSAAAQLLSYLSVAQARQGDLAGAAASNERLLELMPGNVAALRNLAILARDQGKPEEAMQWLNEAFTAAGQNAGELKSLYQLAAELYQAQGDTAQVIAQYENIRQVDPNDAGALVTLLGLYAGAGDDTKVVELGQQLMQLDPQNYQHPLTVAQALISQQRSQEAVAYAQQALALAPDEQKPAIQELLAQLGG
jgi:predicted Zn-dependent protease